MFFHNHFLRFPNYINNKNERSTNLQRHCFPCKLKYSHTFQSFSVAVWGEELRLLLLINTELLVPLCQHITDKESIEIVSFRDWIIIFRVYRWSTWRYKTIAKITHQNKFCIEVCESTLAPLFLLCSFFLPTGHAKFFTLGNLLCGFFNLKHFS